MKKSLVLFSLLAASAMLLAAAGDKTIVVPAGTSRPGSINAFNSELVIDGKVADSIFLIGGSLRLSGAVNGDVICLGAQVDIKEGAFIGRDLIIIGGRLAKDPGCKINGESYYVRTREDLKKISHTLLPFLPESGGMTFFRVSKIFLWFILVMLALLILPLQVSRAADMLKKSPLRHGAVGLLAMLAFILLLLVFIILSLVLIGIPLLMLLIAAYFLVLIFGRAVVFFAVGSAVAAGLRIKSSPVLFVVLGTMAYALLKFVPWIGAPLLLLMDIVAIGVAVGYFLKYKGLGSRV
ncbi:MAG: hypothetical protein NTW95_10110 [Candidatus Aminicenantes bacterium]|nr:hypothetical protein [Candidatus Aminicenantes bacterium]